VVARRRFIAAARRLGARPGHRHGRAVRRGEGPRHRAGSEVACPESLTWGEQGVDLPPEHLRRRRERPHARGGRAHRRRAAARSRSSTPAGRCTT
jgi:hypothetical protein